MPSATAGPQLKTLYLEWEPPPGQHVPIYELAALFQSLGRVLWDLSLLAHDKGVLPSLDDIDVVSVELHSPLKISLGVTRLPKNAVRAFKHICERILFLDQERDRRAALAASAWEDVTAKRLTNYPRGNRHRT